MSRSGIESNSVAVPPSSEISTNPYSEPRNSTRVPVCRALDAPLIESSKLTTSHNFGLSSNLTSLDTSKQPLQLRLVFCLYITGYQFRHVWLFFVKYPGYCHDCWMAVEAYDIVMCNPDF